MLLEGLVKVDALQKQYYHTRRLRMLEMMIRIKVSIFLKIPISVVYDNPGNETSNRIFSRLPESDSARSIFGEDAGDFISMVEFSTPQSIALVIAEKDFVLILTESFSEHNEDPSILIEATYNCFEQMSAVLSPEELEFVRKEFLPTEFDM